MPTAKLKQFLDSNNVDYIPIPHAPTFTALQTAETAHIPSSELAKTVLIKVNNSLCMLVVPATRKVDFEFLTDVLGTDEVELAGEWEFNSRFPDCETGAMPPFGNLYDMTVYVDSALTDSNQIAFNSGTHSEIVRLRYQDYEKLVAPIVISLDHH